ncbi:hypothetical protein P4H70_30615 [Paenibacillus ehimensis]|nr:hypothetical protein [Paenibacillus ehimensis]MEC0213292.1 hypothetical protein [Paenibacillus ehimensis]
MARSVRDAIPRWGRLAGHPRKHHAIVLGYPAAGPPALRRWHLEAVRGA